MERPAYGWVRSGNDFVKTGKGEADGIMRAAYRHPPGLAGAFHYNVHGRRQLQVVSFAQQQPVPARGGAG